VQRPQKEVPWNNPSSFTTSLIPNLVTGMMVVITFAHPIKCFACVDLGQQAQSGTIMCKPSFRGLSIGWLCPQLLWIGAVGSKAKIWNQNEKCKVSLKFPLHTPEVLQSYFPFHACSLLQFHTHWGIWDIVNYLLLAQGEAVGLVGCHLHTTNCKIGTPCFVCTTWFTFNLWILVTLCMEPQINYFKYFKLQNEIRERWQCRCLDMWQVR
jgi:hypothetical protein